MTTGEWKFCDHHDQYYPAIRACHHCVKSEAAPVVEGGIKYDSGKPEMDLLSTEALRQIAAVMSYGVSKYGRHNWRGGIEWSRVIAAALRHLTAFNEGEDKDPETGLSHLAHAGCCIHFLLEYEKYHQAKDDRYKREKK